MVFMDTRESLNTGVGDCPAAGALAEPWKGDGGERQLSAEDLALSSRARAAANGLSLPARLEAILYLKGRPLSLSELSQLAGCAGEEAETALITLMTDYAHRETALEIHQDGDGYSLQLRANLGELVQELLPVELSTATLRTLATVALKKRLLQSELVDLRGGGAYDHIKELVKQGFLERRRQSDGRSYWISLSEKFHRTFRILDADRPAAASHGSAAQTRGRRQR